MPEISTPQETAHHDLPNTFPLNRPKPKILSLMMGDLPEPPFPVIRYSTTAKRWSIHPVTSVTNVCPFLSQSFLSIHLLPGRNTGYKSFDPSHPCRKCWDKHSKSYSGPIIYASWNDGPSNRQRPLSNLRSTATNPSLSFTRSLSSIVNQARDDLSSSSANPARRSHPSPSSPVHPSRRFPVPPPLPARPRSESITTQVNRNTSSNWPRSPAPPPVSLRPGDPRIGGNLCWNCLGSGRTFGFLLLTNNTCDLCGGVGRLL